MENNEIEIIETPVSEETPAKKQSNVLAILSLVCGILAIVFNCCCNWVSLPCAIGALVLALVAPKNENGKMEGMCIAGMILAGVSALFFVVNIIISIFSASANILLVMLESMGLY